MKRLDNVRVGLDELADLTRIAAERTGDDPTTIARVHVRRRSLDARGHRPRWVLSLDVWYVGEDEPPSEHRPDQPAPDVVDRDKRVVIVGTGPAGLFAALRYADAGVPVTVLDRGAILEERHGRAKAERAARAPTPTASSTRASAPPASDRSTSASSRSAPTPRSSSTPTPTSARTASSRSWSASGPTC